MVLAGRGKQGVAKSQLRLGEIAADEVRVVICENSR